MGCTVFVVLVIAAGVANLYLRVLPRERRQQWRSQGRCARCGYDLTGNVSGVCPECATPRGATVVQPRDPVGVGLSIVFRCLAAVGVALLALMFMGIVQTLVELFVRRGR